MIRINQFLFAVVVLLLTGCGLAGNRSIDPIHFDLSGELDRQAKLLSERGASLSKTVLLGEEESVGTLSPDSAAAWSEELQLFYAADINQPRYIDRYKVKEGKDPNSNLMLTEYICDDEDVPVSYLSVAWLGSRDNPVRIHARVKDDNAGFNIQRELGMHYEDIGGKYLLSQYTIKGIQKLPGLDTVSYSIIATVNFK